jgi:hypothetical protein
MYLRRDPLFSLGIECNIKVLTSSYNFIHSNLDIVFKALYMFCYLSAGYFLKVLGSKCVFVYVKSVLMENNSIFM